MNLSHGYNNLGHRVELQTNVGTWSTGLDGNNRIASIQAPGGMNYAFNYDSANRLNLVTRPGSVTTLAFDPASHLTQILHKQGSNTVSGFNYQVDSVGNRTQIQSMLGTSSFNYDNEGQLVSASLPEIQEVFAYDNLGNRVSDHHGDFSYDEKRYRLTEDYAFLYAFDANGNMVSKQSKGLNGLVYNFSYSADNQLNKVGIFEGTTHKLDV
ncbi:MAG: hypothetical protein ACLGG0_15550, partial [Bacteriovoracia bacterium]